MVPMPNHGQVSSVPKVQFAAPLHAKQPQQTCLPPPLGLNNKNNSLNRADNLNNKFNSKHFQFYEFISKVKQIQLTPFYRNMFVYYLHYMYTI